MISLIHIAECALPAISEKNALRYAGDHNPTTETLSLLKDCIKECNGIFAQKAVYRILPIERRRDELLIGGMNIKSDALMKNLQSCDTVIIFAASAGFGMDRLIAKYSKISPAKALLLHGIGTERVEALCDSFCEMLTSQMNLRLAPRFSPGYGDLALGIQKEVLNLLNASKTLGIGLNSSMLLSPAKTVTAFVGIKTKECDLNEFQRIS